MKKMRCPLNVECLESRELLANTIVYSAATHILTIDGSSAGDVVVVSQLANHQIDVRMDHPGSSLPGLDQLFAQPISQVDFFGHGGTESFQDETAIPCSAYAGNGNAILVGGSGTNFLVGGPGNDELFAGAGSSVLIAGTGQNALGDGPGRNLLIGGRGADRFLLTNPANDYILNQTAADARIYFVGVTGTENLGTEQVVGTHAAWSQPDVQAVDFALSEIEQRVGNTSLLKMPDGTPLTFRRQGVDSNPNSLLLGWNTLDGKITLLDNAFADLQWLHRTVYHEIGHNWEDTSDNKLWGAFTGLSGWSYGASSPNLNLYTQAPETDSSWWFKKGTAFVRDYSRTNPWEDWATSVEAYFSQTFTHEMEAGAELAPAKINVVNQFLTSKM
jgi:hypothetical protein